MTEKAKTSAPTTVFSRSNSESCLDMLMKLTAVVFLIFKKLLKEDNLNLTISEQKYPPLHRSPSPLPPKGTTATTKKKKKKKKSKQQDNKNKTK